ncbi:tRNA lysidine(34) synthetase TilS [Cellulomonas sp. PhB150]|uniref:tRNA lysidine(34) synthetase TilS n=1 Tax=Cellulomonas sp. PhB150 TaxID=2485188 RepID=UPI000F483845|nr:tRNA lysidine(34) synthetase TilS [Cellulomonas sp. PhB150]ROS25899.1 tRNA(Ile)-lysidine synthase [Cellulomonas sp. PhB150]
MSGPHLAVAAARTAVSSATADLPAGSLVLVACSGGTDSLALASAAAFVARRGELRAGAVVVDHGLQDGSAEVAERAAATCRRLGLDPVLVVRVSVDAAGGPEAAARAARYAALEDAAEREGAAAVLLGHTLDDQAETVLLGLARGSGARSLAGMPAVRGVLRRPVLGLRRADTAAACEAQGLVPWHDPTNDGGPGDPLRSRVRAEVMPLLDRVLGSGVPEALSRTAEQLAEDAAALDALAADLVATARRAAGASRAADPRRTAGPGRPVGPTSARPDDATDRRDASASGVELDVGVLAGALTAVRRRALRAAAVAAGSPAGSTHRVHVLALDALVVDWHGQGPVALPGGLAGSRAYGTLVIGPPRPSSVAVAAGDDEGGSPIEHTNEE